MSAEDLQAAWIETTQRLLDAALARIAAVERERDTWQRELATELTTAQAEGARLRAALAHHDTCRHCECEHDAALDGGTAGR